MKTAIRTHPQPFSEPGGKLQVSTSGGIQPGWQAVGKELFFIAPDAKLMSATITTSGAVLDASPPVALFQTRIFSGGSSGANKHHYAVAGDGRFLITQTVEESTISPIRLILNWNPEQKK